MWRPNIQIQAILADIRIRIPHIDTVKFRYDRVDQLITTIRQHCGIQSTVPIFNRDWPFEP